MRRPVATLLSIAENIVREFFRIAQMPQPYVDDENIFPLPRMIATDDGGSIIISNAIDVAITEISRRMMENDQALPLRYTVSEWNKVVRNAFGPALAQLDFAGEPNAQAEILLRTVKCRLETESIASVSREHSFGCTLFGNAVSGFQIGPVRFEPRLEWLDRQLEAGTVPVRDNAARSAASRRS